MVIEAGHISKSFGPQNVLNDVNIGLIPVVSDSAEKIR